MKKLISLMLAVIMVLAIVPMSLTAAADLGDVTGDGKINSRDIASLQRFIAGSTQPTAEQAAAADITGDGKVNSRDIASLQKHISGVQPIVPTTTQAPEGDGIITVAELAQAAKTILAGYTSGTPFYPDGVEVDGTTLAQQNYYYIAAQAIQDINNGNTAATYDSSALKYAVPALVANYTFEYPEVNKNFYMNFAVRQTIYADKNGRIGASAGYPTTDANANGFPVTDFEGQFNYESGLLMFTRVLASYADTGVLPETVAVESVPATDSPATQAPATPAPNQTQSPAVSGTISISEAVDGISRAYAEFEETGKFPEALTIGDAREMNKATYFALASKALIAINNGSTADIALKNYNNPAYPNRFDTFTSETISKKAVIYIAEKQVAYADGHGGTFANYTTFPGTSSTSYSGLANFDRCLAVVVRIIAEYKETGALADTISSWPSSYTSATKNCESDNETIIETAKTVTAGCTTDEEKAKAIYEYVETNIKYEYYSDTRRSAVKVHEEKLANCCDHAHYTIALARSLGIPARYVHIDGYWGSSVYGHVYAELFVNGEWVTCDTSMDDNTYGNHEVWELKTHHANYVELYF